MVLGVVVVGWLVMDGGGNAGWRCRSAGPMPGKLVAAGQVNTARDLWKPAAIWAAQRAGRAETKALTDLSPVINPAPG